MSKTSRRLSHEQKQEEPSPFAGRESDPKKEIQISKFSNWYSDHALNEPEILEEHPISKILNFQTKTVKYLVAYIRPKQEYIDFVNNNKDDVCFWQSSYVIANEPIEDLNHIVKNQFSVLISPSLVIPLVNQQMQVVLQQVRQVKMRKNVQRIVFHYIAHQIENSPRESLQFPYNEQLHLKDLLDVSGESSCFIFDRDRAGSLFPIFKEFASQNSDNQNSNNNINGSNLNHNINNCNSVKQNNHKNNLNTVAFFSCGEYEMLPRSTDYPTDLFTSCLTSPARVALVWHSRHYYCFQSGSLQPISLMFLEEIDAADDLERQRVKALLDDLYSTLKSTVEAIALKSIDPELFVKLFRSDNVISELTVNFILACRILNCFNTHPKSYPELPNMNNSREWHTFDLRLDAALYLLSHGDNQIIPTSSLTNSFNNTFNNSFGNNLYYSNNINSMNNLNLSNLNSTINSIGSNIKYSGSSNSINIINSTNNNQNLHSNNNRLLSYHHFLRQVLDTFKNMMNSQIESVYPPFELSFLPSIINDPELSELACEVLAKYLDSSKKSVEFVLYYPIPKALFGLLLKNKPNNLSKHILFCLIKILAYHQSARYSLLELNQSLVEKVLIASLKESLNSSSHLVVILLALLMKDSVSIFRQMITDPSVFTRLGVDRFEGDSRLWALNIISGAVASIKDYILIGRLLEPILQICKTATPELHATLVSSLSSFIKTNSAITPGSKDSLKKRKQVEHKAVEAAFEFEKSSSYKVRRELFILSKKFYESNLQKFSSQTNNNNQQAKPVKPFYAKIAKFIENCEKDPDETVRKAQQSTILNSYISMLLRPIRKLLNGNFSFEEIFEGDNANPETYDSINEFEIITNSTKMSSISPNGIIDTGKIESGKRDKPRSLRKQTQSHVRRNSMKFKPIQQKPLKINTSYHHSAEITSELTYLNDMKYSFGDSNGNVCIKEWENSINLLHSYNIKSKCPIIDLEYTNNSGDPLLFAVNTERNCYVQKIQSDYSLLNVGSFPLYGDNRVKIDKKRGMLISYAFCEGNEYHVRDLRTDRFLPSIIPKIGPTKDIQFVSYFDDVFAICGSGFECYDLRASVTEPCFSVCDDLESPALQLEIVEETIPTFAFALECHSVCKIDMRHPEGMRTSKIFCCCEQCNQRTFGFAVQPRAMTAAISTEDGVTCVNVQNYMQEEIAPNIRNGMRIENPSSLLFHPNEFSLSLVNNGEYIMTAS
ncbi:hypothetical protein TRFO_38834 [Tritrichomonas foetus]|uniref:Raptor N-terminal CASPase-like domain-containing protein n=1 Tax=Tritrichomonas foetus TaxID=1144522 RepID=A0A1J4JCH3_9EUKA|nr:hypothetical protein TRFO_38834 [Tritrichomonas foetus]|eukprot:OHS94972.1 hypothetical protein TRFO_38834 [Tritrichomonas foetus]